MRMIGVRVQRLRILFEALVEHRGAAFSWCSLIEGLTKKFRTERENVFAVIEVRMSQRGG